MCCVHVVFTLYLRVIKVLGTRYLAVKFDLTLEAGPHNFLGTLGCRFWSVRGEDLCRFHIFKCTVHLALRTFFTPSHVRRSLLPILSITLASALITCQPY